jgi:hypothetical protein
MIFAFIEDGTLEIHEDEASATRAHEGIDVESGTVHFYSGQGMPLAPRFTAPNARGRWLGLFPWVSSGAYQLVPAASSEVDPFELALREAVALAPNPWFSSLEELKAALRQRGVIADTST